MLCHVSRAEGVTRECDIHDTRSIKTNSAVNLSRKPEPDFCCDLLQHLQGVPRTCRFFLIILFILLTCNRIIHILPLSLFAGYSIRAQNGYWQHCRKKSSS